MAKNYCFEFSGTREDFLNTLNEHPGYDNKFYYFDGYIVEIENGEYKFGVARGGHSGGYWYLPETSEKGGSLCFNGQIKHLSHHTTEKSTEKSTEKGIKKALHTIDEILFLVFLLPFLLIIKCYSLIDLLIRKLKKVPKEMTIEEKLFDLMVNHLHCNEVLETDR